MREQDIIHENGNFWVGKTKSDFTVFVVGATHSVSDSTYEDLSVAVARCDYLAGRYTTYMDAINLHSRLSRSHLGTPQTSQ